MERQIYLDYHSTCPMDPAVLDAMVPYFLNEYGNASSRNHRFGWRAEEAVEAARREIASYIGADAREILFTSGGTESDNLAILGIAEQYADKGKHIITSAIEHKAVLDPCLQLERQGYRVTVLPVDAQGQISIEELEKSITSQTILVSIMAANNEVGTIQRLSEIGALCKARGVFFHTDAVQAIGKTPIDVEAMGIDLLSMTAHKIYGPKGIGALYVRRRSPRVRLSPLMYGGGHERGMRSGTLNVPGIVGFAKAIAILKEKGDEEVKRLRMLRDRLWNQLQSNLEDIYLNGHETERLVNSLNVSFAYVEGESLMMGIKELAVSSGSACTSTSLEPSYVLKAIGVGEDLAHTSIRFSVGRFTTEEDIDFAAERVIQTVRKLRDLSPLYEMAKEGVDLKSVAWTAH